jgi:hypothetical protein
VVTIRATDPFASESGDTGTFTVFRAGPTNNALNVFCRIGGTASNGVDYVTLQNIINVPAGSRTADVTVVPIPDNVVDGTKTVDIKLIPSPIVGPAADYVVGTPAEAVVFITDNGGSNLPPVVRMASPPNGAVFRAPVNIPLSAFASDPDGMITSVEFFQDTNSLGFGRGISATATGIANVYVLIYSNALVGTYTLSALATDNGGASTRSDPVTITVLPPLPPPTNRPPIVTIAATDPLAIEGTNCWIWPRCTNATATWSNWSGSPCMLFTNCGPKSALFTVHRFGVTNDALTVDYDIGGTASNGVDYVTIPGSVTIAAGDRSALIPIVPIDDGPPDKSTTVVLRLKPSPSTNAIPDYLLGFPRSAAVLILDGAFPRPTTGLLADNSFYMSASGPDGAWYHVEYSSDMANWTPICTNQVFYGSINFVDPDAAGNPVRFYRAVPENNPPAQ